MPSAVWRMNTLIPDPAHSMELTRGKQMSPLTQVAQNGPNGWDITNRALELLEYMREEDTLRKASIDLLMTQECVQAVRFHSMLFPVKN